MADPATSRHRFQFRLRTLMIVVTLLAAGCWCVMDRQRLIRERDDAIQRQKDTEALASKDKMATVKAVRSLLNRHALTHEPQSMDERWLIQRPQQTK
jgi:hypothetical protein